MSAAKRGVSGLSGILAVDKPAGMTSHDVVARVRRVTGEGRVGHAGTLDPAATGVLVVLVGPAARLASLLTGQTKSYRAVIIFGAATDTDDADGRVVREAEVPASLLDPAVAATLVQGLIGDHLQVPPAYSAIKRDGVTAYKAARLGEALEIEPRPVTVFDAQLVDVDGSARSWTVDLTVSKGTYIRSIARDLGEQLGSAAHLSGLRRTSSGAVTLDQCVQLDGLTTTADVISAFIDPVEALGLPVVEIDGPATADGRPVAVGANEAGVSTGQSVSVVDGDGRLLGVYRATDESLVAQTYLAGGVAGKGSV